MVCCLQTNSDEEHALRLIRFVPVQSVKVCRGGEVVVTPLILNHGTSWRPCYTPLPSPRNNPSTGRTGDGIGPRIGVEVLGNRRFFTLIRIRAPDRSARILVIIPTTLSRLLHKYMPLLIFMHICTIGGQRIYDNCSGD